MYNIQHANRKSPISNLQSPISIKHKRQDEMSTEAGSIENKQSEGRELNTSQFAESMQQIMAREDVSVVVIYKNNKQQHTISGLDFIENVEEIVGGQKVSRLVISKANGETLLDISLRAGVGMTVLSLLLLPKVLGLGVVGALLARLKVEVVSPKTKIVEVMVNQAE